MTNIEKLPKSVQKFETDTTRAPNTQTQNNYPWWHSRSQFSNQNSLSSLTSRRRFPDMLPSPLTLVLRPPRRKSSPKLSEKQHRAADSNRPWPTLTSHPPPWPRLTWVHCRIAAPRAYTSTVFAKNLQGRERLLFFFRNVFFAGDGDHEKNSRCDAARYGRFWGQLHGLNWNNERLCGEDFSERLTLVDEPVFVYCFFIVVVYMMIRWRWHFFACMPNDSLTLVKCILFFRVIRRICLLFCWILVK